MFQTGKTVQVERKMSLYSIDISGVSECSWTGNGERYGFTRELSGKFHGGCDGVKNKDGKSITIKDKTGAGD